MTTTGAHAAHAHADPEPARLAAARFGPQTSAQLIQRACSCGGSAGVSGSCASCAAEERLGIQPKLTVSRPGDQWEQEADRIADQVLAGGALETPLAHRISRVQRETQDDEDDSVVQTKRTGRSHEFGDDDETLQAKGEASGPSATGAAAAAAAVASGGQPLDPSARAYFEPRFGVDLSHVRLHTDARAASAASSINARAYTLGHHIAFGAAAYRPDTFEGRRLIAHELTHTLQQGAGVRRVIQRTPTIEATPHNPDACACLVHVHNDERNAKAVANLLHGNCDYNLLQVGPDNSRRHLDSDVRLPNGRRERDPNQFFDRDLVESCETAITSGCDPLTTACPGTGNFSCEFYARVRRCSNVFQVPVVALHNNVQSDTERYRRTLGRRGGPDIGSQLFGPGKTNIYQWCRSPAISRCIIGDRDHPDHVIWVSNEADFVRLAGSPGLNVALQDRTFTDQDLSSLFNILPTIQAWQYLRALTPPFDFSGLSRGLPGVATDYRYINIETPHRPGRFDTSLAVDNFMFVTSVLERLGLACCDEDALRALRDDPAELERRLTQTHEGLSSDE